jgi:IS30 family transposase
VYHLEVLILVTSSFREEELPMISSEVFMDIYHLHRRGYSIRKIAKTLGVHRLTVKRHMESNSFPEYKKRKQRESILTPYYRTIHDFLEEDDYQAT